MDYKGDDPTFNQTISISVACKHEQTEDRNISYIDYWRLSSTNTSIINKIVTKNRESQQDDELYQEAPQTEEQRIPGMIIIAILDSYSKTLNSFFTSVSFLEI